MTNILVVGCGGIGSFFIRELYQLYESAEALDIKFRVMIEDSGFYEVEKGVILMIGILATQNEAELLGLKKLRLYQ